MCSSDLITQKGPAPFNATRTELWSAPGQVKVGAAYENETRTFKVPFQRYNFPLASGKVWNQWDDTFNEATSESGQINRYVRLSGWDKVSTPAGTFDAISMQVVMRLDDETFWRWPTTCNYMSQRARSSTIWRAIHNIAAIRTS